MLNTKRVTLQPLKKYHLKMLREFRKDLLQDDWNSEIAWNQCRIHQSFQLSVISYQLSIPLAVCEAFRRKARGLKYGIIFSLGRLDMAQVSEPSHPTGSSAFRASVAKQTTAFYPLKRGGAYPRFFGKTLFRKP